MKRYRYLILKKIKKLKQCLEEYKIFFETIVMFSLTIMSIVVAYKANVISDRANELTEIEASIAHNEKLPSFTGVDYNDDEYKILNVGGVISNASAMFNYYVHVNMSNGVNTQAIVLEVIDAYEDSYVGYDYNDCSFSTGIEDLTIYYMMQVISEKMAQYGIDIEYQMIQIVEIYYTNYEDNTYVEYYTLGTLDKTSINELTTDEYVKFFRKYETVVWASKKTQEENPESIESSLIKLEEIILEKMGI